MSEAHKEYNKVGFDLLKIVLFVAVILLIPYLIYYSDKKRCEDKGGIFIFELGSRGSQCHFTMEAKR